uniref:Uncharacterized protein n=1 Tax=Leptosiphonia brodiei TaxID=2608611 RepID=A0A1Z1MA68_9FLOR|nr:hypothetical protein [Leptosiphonia brodiei]ARW62849.1 hypothetical protein [Leptosiphonia brodiei]
MKTRLKKIILNTSLKRQYKQSQKDQLCIAMKYIKKNAGL